MPRPEQTPIRKHSRERPEVDRQQLVDFLSRVQKDPNYSLYFETQLDKAGLLAPLEEAGILPVAANPNPLDPVEQEKAHDEWAQRHKAEMERFIRQYERRNEVIGHLVLGAIIGHLFPALFAQHRFPDRNRSGRK